MTVLRGDGAMIVYRCGHGRNLHRPTSRGMAYAAAERRKGRKYATKAPCMGGARHQYCKCRDFVRAKRQTYP